MTQGAFGAPEASDLARNKCAEAKTERKVLEHNVEGGVELNPAPCESHRNGIQLDKPFASVVCAQALLGFGSRKVGRPRVLVSPGFAPV